MHEDIDTLETREWLDALARSSSRWSGARSVSSR